MNIPKELIRVVEKAMAKDPAERFATANLLADALARIIHHSRGASL